MKRICLAGLLALTPLGPAQAASLFTSAGDYTGTGRIAPGVDTAMGRAKCKLEVTASTPQDVSITGRCVLVAGSTNVSMRFVKTQGNVVRGGVRSPSSDEIVQFEGVETGDTMRLRTVAPVDVDGALYNSIVTLDFTSADSFAMEQLVRKIGDEAWVRVVDMTFEMGG